MHAADDDMWKEAVKSVLHLVRSISLAHGSANRNHQLFISILIAIALFQFIHIIVHRHYLPTQYSPPCFCRPTGFL